MYGLNYILFVFSNYSATISNNLIKCNHLIIDFLRMLKIALCRPSIWNIFPNEPSQVIHLNIVLHFPQGLMPCFSYCLKHTAVCQGCWEWGSSRLSVSFYVYFVGAVVHHCFVRKP